MKEKVTRALQSAKLVAEKVKTDKNWTKLAVMAEDLETMKNSLEAGLGDFGQDFLISETKVLKAKYNDAQLLGLLPSFVGLNEKAKNVQDEMATLTDMVAVRTASGRK